VEDDRAEHGGHGGRVDGDPAGDEGRRGRRPWRDVDFAGVSSGSGGRLGACDDHVRSIGGHPLAELALSGADDDVLRPARRLLLAASVVTPLLNVASPLFAG
jgi:hypothetical protein